MPRVVGPPWFSRWPLAATMRWGMGLSRFTACWLFLFPVVGFKHAVTHEVMGDLAEQVKRCSLTGAG